MPTAVRSDKFTKRTSPSPARELASRLAETSIAGEATEDVEGTAAPAAAAAGAGSSIEEQMDLDGIEIKSCGGSWTRSRESTGSSTR